MLDGKPHPASDLQADSEAGPRRKPGRLRRFLPYLAGALIPLAPVAAYLFMIQWHFMGVMTYGRIQFVSRALEAFEETHGVFPRSLAELPIPLKDAEDVWGRPLFYQRIGQGYLLASFGFDGEEDRRYGWQELYELIEKEHHPWHSGPYRGRDCSNLNIDQIRNETGWYRGCNN